jgi:predicted ArsR family transcriptional regulator
MALARNTDPQTSHEAAARVSNTSATQRTILQLLAFPRSDEELVRAFEELAKSGLADYASPSGIRTRRAELTDMGYVEDSELRTKTASGRTAIVWMLTEAGRNA